MTTACYTCYHWLPRVLKSFSREYPNVDVNIFPEFTHKPLEGLQKGEVDLVITSDDTSYPGIAYRELFRDEQVAVVPCCHPWTKKAFVEPKDFADETFIIYGGPHESVSFFRNTLMPAVITPKRTIPIELTEATIEMIKVGWGEVRGLQATLNDMEALPLSNQ